MARKETVMVSFMRALHSTTLALVGAVWALVSASAPASAEPALWIAKGPNATVYLFGTVHVLRKDQAWETPTIEKALSKSQEIWLEIPDLNDTAEARSLVSQLGFDPQHPLSAKLKPAELARIDHAAKTIGLPDGEKSLEPMRPWLVSITLLDASITEAGFDPESGVEKALLRDKAAAGKPVHGFETLDQQLHFFANLAPPLELEMLKQSLHDFDQGPALLNEMVDAWARGDQAATVKLLVEDMKSEFPTLYRTLIVKRNQAWADKIGDMLKGSGVRFVAVGAAHLAGPDSVQHALEGRGFPVERITAVE